MSSDDNVRTVEVLLAQSGLPVTQRDVDLQVMAYDALHEAVAKMYAVAEEATPVLNPGGLASE